MEIVPRRPTLKGQPQWFTGDVWYDVVARADDPGRTRMNIVRFSPSARTRWHSHALGQTLYITDGMCLVQSRGGKVVLLRPTEAVWTPPSEEHWHGAAPDRFMVHAAVWEGDDITWGDPVTDEEYAEGLLQVRLAPDEW